MQLRRASLVPVCVMAMACAGAEVTKATRSEVSSSRLPASNVLRADYIGSSACAGCHASIHEAWQRSPMHRMTRDLAGADVSAPFDGRELTLGADIARLELRDGRRFVALSRAGESTLYRVTKVIGGRYREDFVGELVRADAPFSAALQEQRVLPVSYLRFDGTLRYKGYSVMVPERHGLEPGLVWQRACVLCHNTAPQLVGLYDELYGAGSPSYQGSASNELPETKAFRYVVDDAAALRQELAKELSVMGARGRLPEGATQALEVAISNTRERLDESHLVELGVGCESCHGGARARARRSSPSLRHHLRAAELVHARGDRFR